MIFVRQAVVGAQNPFDYQKTIDLWLKNLFDNRAHCKQLAGEAFYSDYRAYLKAARRFMASEVYLLDIVTSRKMEA